MTSDPDRIAHFLLKPVARACKEFGLLRGGDRVAVAVSGGKDSRALLDLLLRYRRRAPFSYELVALHIFGVPAGPPDGSGGRLQRDLRLTLEPWFRERGVEYHFAPLELPPDEPLPLDCFRCSWNRRKALFTAAADLGCDKLALGHHADDAAATTLMNLMFGGRLETMEPRVEFFDGAVVVVRPLIYVPEKDLARYGRASGFPRLHPCPQAGESKRAQMRGFLRQFGRDQRQIRANLWRAARREMGF